MLNDMTYHNCNPFHPTEKLCDFRIYQCLNIAEFSIALLVIYCFNTFFFVDVDRDSRDPEVLQFQFQRDVIYRFRQA